MSKLEWGLFQDRLFETGVDRGALYVDDEIGVAWNGLTSVKENPNGADPKPYYLDGVKYLNLAESEEFAGSISAFNYPALFARCFGMTAIHNGLFITEQPRRPFNFTYRTRLGNAIQGAEYSYKIHLVWNALAGKSDKENQTITSSPTPVVLTWPITTLPPITSGYKPSAHMIVDASLTPAELLSDLEDMLYGTDELDARFPTQDELIAMFMGVSPP